MHYNECNLQQQSLNGALSTATVTLRNKNQIYHPHCPQISRNTPTTRRGDATVLKVGGGAILRAEPLFGQWGGQNIA